MIENKCGCGPQFFGRCAGSWALAAEGCFFTEKCLLILALVFACSPLCAQAPASSEARISREIAASWNALQVKAESLSPEARIAAVDQWQNAQQQKLEELKRENIKSIRAELAQTTTPPSKAPLTELEKITAAIENEFQAIGEENLSPQERIQQVDAAMKKTAALQASRARLLREAANPATPMTTPMPADAKTPEGRLAIKSREMLERTEDMSPEDRIATIDRMKPNLDTLLREVRLSNEQAAESTVNSKPSTH